MGETTAVVHGGNPQDPSGSPVVHGGNPQDHTGSPHCLPKTALAQLQNLNLPTQVTRSQALLGNADPDALPLFLLLASEAEPLGIGSQAEPLNQ
jgi:hypothetical protein